MMMNNFLTFWLNNIVSVECKKSTADNYKSIVDKHISPMLGGTLLQSLSLKDALEFRSDLMAKSLAASTINKIINTLKIILNHAVDLDYISTSPVSKLSFIEEGDTNIQPLTDSELKAIRSSNLAHKELYIFTLYTGLRIGEAAALTPDDVSECGSYIRVNKTLGRHGITSTKSKKMRVVPLHPEAKEILRSRKDQDRLFIINPSRFTTKIFKPELESIGVRPIRFHDLRHTFATRYLANGGNITHLSLILGHSSVKITQDIYVHLDEKDLMNNLQGVNFGY